MAIPTHKLRKMTQALWDGAAKAESPEVKARLTRHADQHQKLLDARNCLHSPGNECVCYAVKYVC